MFETVAPDASQRNRLVFYESLPLSLVILAIVIGIAGFAIINRLQFPLEPPRLLVSYIETELTPPPPPPPPPPPRAGSSNVASTTATLPVNIARIQELAPTIIPEAVPELPPPQPRAQLASFTPSAPASSAGVRGGVDGGVAGGTVGGVRNGIVGGVMGDDGRLYLKKDAPLPLYAESRPFPEYPEYQRSLAREETVVVRYVIGKDGQVHDAAVTNPTKHKEFALSALQAIRQWRFRPLIIDGEAIEVVHEITVYFRLY
jgi:protein TonB